MSEPFRTIQGHTDNVTGIAFFQDGRRVVTCSKDTSLRIWDVQTGELLGEPFVGHEDAAVSVSISPDERRIASGGEDRAVIIWDVESKENILGPLLGHGGRVRTICFSPNGKRLASGSSGNVQATAVVWDTDTGAVVLTLVHRNAVLSVAFSPESPTA
ncbi:WD40 repeat-like protein [Rhizopogon salebrosus TDB-379]|nr:WD40 repeat-like protein [Rhizopogon salebrosus TDB-379]